MKNKFIKSISLLMALVLIGCTFTFSAVTNVSADTVSEIQSEIDRLEKESAALQKEINELKNSINSQQKLKNAIENNMAVVQRQINACNNKINSINSTIEANEAQIEANNKKIEADTITFKKRLRAIKMSNVGSNIQILLGSKSFSEFLQLSQLTASITARDKKLLENIVDEIERLKKKQEENQKLLDEQAEIKATISKKQDELRGQANEIQKVINSINKDKNEIQSDKNAVDKELAAMESTLNDILYGSSGGNLENDGKFLWPTNFKRISSYYGKRWGRMHNGVDISNGSYGKPIYAMADGKVYQCYTSCRHNYGKSPLRTCCNGYGNYVAIDHGKYNGANYKAYYAHMGSVNVKNGDYVKKGQIIGYIGSTGRSTGPHLHFGIMKNNTWVNPMNYF